MSADLRDDFLFALEGQLLEGLVDASAARRALLEYLRNRFEEYDENDLSVAEILEDKASQGPDKELGCVLIRCLPYSGVIPDKSASSSISRSVVEICQKSLPVICKFIHLDPGSQTFQKYSQLLSAHDQLTAPLQPLLVKSIDIESAIAMQRQVLGALNHGVLNSYAEIYGLSEVRMLVDDVFLKLKAVALFRQSLADDIQACRSTLKGAEAAADGLKTFLTNDYLKPFLLNMVEVVGGIESDLREKFATSVSLVHGHALPKRYQINEVGRNLRISIPFTNNGPGKLIGLKATVAQTGGVLVKNEQIIIGDITPGRFPIVVDVCVEKPSPSCKILVDLEWSEIGAPTQRSDIFEVEVIAQSVSVDWPQKEFWAPYSTEPAQGTEFVGRSERVKQVASKVLRTPMEPFYITGQKRVGKTSLASAAVSFAEANSGAQIICSKFVLWGEIAYQDTHSTIRELGSAFEDLLRSNVDLRQYPEINCSDSLAPLVKLCQHAYEIDPSKKFVFIIDEFDEIHQELYLHGALAETFFANLRALTRCRNICLALIGGENMPYVMDRQGQRLNNFSKISLNYYSREKEWDDFRLLVTAPAAEVISWHDDAISEIFNITNGNPYFAKIVCASVLRRAILERDADVSYEEVRDVVAEEVSSLGSNYFAHLWQDGIPKPTPDREPEILARARVLVAIARCLRRGLALTLPNIVASKGALDLRETEVTAVLSDFVRREVLDERDNNYKFLLPLFSLWLEDVGVAALAETTLSKELAASITDEEQAATVKSEEIVKLVKSWPTYRGRHIGPEDVRAWLGQVESLRQQRILFKVLQCLHFFTDIFIRERLESVHNLCVLPHLDTLVRNRKSDKRKDVIVTYVDGEGKSGQTYASYYAEQNLISSDCIVPPGEFSVRFSRMNVRERITKYAVIVDDLVATGKSLADNVAKFVSDNEPIFMDGTVGLLVCTIASTREGASHIEKEFGKLSCSQLEFRTAEYLVDKDYAFSAGNSIWFDEKESSIAKQLCIDLGISIYGKRGALGYGGLGLLVIFPNSIPNNDLPILHSPSRAGEKVSWAPLFPRVIH